MNNHTNINRLQSIFKQCKAYVAYLTAGDGGLQRSQAAMLALVKGGVDILEIGIPFSDPIADGPTIQQASKRALAQSIHINDVFNLITALRQQTDAAIILFSYYNPILASQNDFYQLAKKAGADGILVVDLSLEEAAMHCHACQQQELAPIFLIAPSTDDARIKLIDQYSHSMIYYVCRNGTTGVKASLPTGFNKKMQHIKSLTNLPIITGFGISNKAMAGQALQYADGFVVGSLFVDALAKGKTNDELTALAASLDPR